MSVPVIRARDGCAEVKQARWGARCNPAFAKKGILMRALSTCAHGFITSDMRPEYRRGTQFA